MEKPVLSNIQYINRLYKEQDDIYKTYAAKCGISPAAFWVFYFLCSADKPYTQHDICTAWFYPKQTVNSVIDSLIKDGYAVKKPMAGSNKKTIELTKYGEKFCNEKIMPIIEAEEKSFLKFSPYEQNMFIELFTKQIKYMKEETEKI